MRRGPKPQAPKKKPLTDIKPLCAYPFGALSKLSVAIMWALLPGSRLYDSSTSSAAAGYNKHNSRSLLFFFTLLACLFVYCVAQLHWTTVRKFAAFCCTPSKVNQDLNGFQLASSVCKKVTMGGTLKIWF